MEASTDKESSHIGPNGSHRSEAAAPASAAPVQPDMHSLPPADFGPPPMGAPPPPPPPEEL